MVTLHELEQFQNEYLLRHLFTKEAKLQGDDEVYGIDHLDHLSNLVVIINQLDAVLVFFVSYAFCEFKDLLF